MLTTADFQPTAARRRRIGALTLTALTTLAAGALVFDHARHTPAATQRALDAAASQADALSDRAVVFSVPTKKKGGTKKHDSGSGDSGSGDSDQGDSSASGGDQTPASVPSGPTGGTSSGSSGVGGSSGSWPASSSPTAPPGPTATTPWLGQSPPTLAAPQIGAPAPAQTLPAQTLPTQVSPQQPAPFAPAAAAAPGVGSVLVQVQCPFTLPPQYQAGGALCFESTTSTGAAATLPPAASLPSLPVVPSPGTSLGCPGASPDSSGSTPSGGSLPPGGSGGTGGSNGTGTSPTTSPSGDSDSSGGDSGSSGDSSSSGDSGSSDDGGGGSASKKKSSKKKSKTSDSAAVLAPGGLGVVSGSVSSCGLLGGPQTSTGSGSGSTGPAADGLGGAAGDLSALEARAGKQIELTGYSFQDNQGGNNAKISCPQIHQQAGGTGTYADPVTVASGGSNGSSSADGIKCGDRFYIASVARYAIVEDTGNTPNKDMPHLDMYVGDDPGSTCMSKITGTVTAIPNPPPGLPVMAGPIGKGGSCLIPGGGSGSSAGKS